MKSFLSLTFLVIISCIAGCKKDYLSLEVNPNSPSVATPGLLLSGSLAVAAAIVEGGNYSEYGVWVGWWTPSGTPSVARG